MSFLELECLVDNIYTAMRGRVIITSGTSMQLSFRTRIYDGMFPLIKPPTPRCDVVLSMARLWGLDWIWQTGLGWGGSQVLFQQRQVSGVVFSKRKPTNKMNRASVQALLREKQQLFPESSSDAQRRRDSRARGQQQTERSTERCSAIVLAGLIFKVSVNLFKRFETETKRKIYKNGER